MDSKLRRVALLSSFAIILLVIALVYGLNQGKRPTTAKPQGEVAPVEKTETVSEISVQDGQIGDDLSGFLEDPHFFDTEENPILESLANNDEELSLIVTSVQKDVRIAIVGEDGKPVSGESFLLDLENMGRYKDIDCDGVVYIGDIDAGEYRVKLLPISGYRVPSEGTTIVVKDKVEYVAISDISLLIKTEEEIDAEAEDTEVVEAKEDADKTEIQKLQTATANSKVGIDVSKWQGAIEWTRVKEAGVQFAIIRAGYRGSVSGSLVIDPYFERNIKGALAAGIPVGVYFFTQAIDEVEAVEEASMVLSLLGEYELSYPIFIDTEGAGGNGRADGLDVDTRTQVCEAFCRTVENAGYHAGVYASRNWFDKRLHAEKLEQYSNWLAEYRRVPKYKGYYQFWQYTSGGSVDGITGRVDMDISYY